jgi:hypothetical protein
MSKTPDKKSAKKAALTAKKPTERELLDQMRVSKIIGPHLRGLQDRPPVPAYWEYQFAIEFSGYDYRFPITVRESVPENDRERAAVEIFKETVALFAKKVKEF